MGVYGQDILSGKSITPGFYLNLELLDIDIDIEILFFVEYCTTM